MVLCLSIVGTSYYLLFLCFNGNSTSVAAVRVSWWYVGKRDGDCHLGAAGGCPQVYTCDLVWMEWAQAWWDGENWLKESYRVMYDARRRQKPKTNGGWCHKNVQLLLTFQDGGWPCFTAFRGIRSKCYLISFAQPWICEGQLERVVFFAVGPVGYSTLWVLLKPCEITRRCRWWKTLASRIWFCLNLLPFLTMSCLVVSVKMSSQGPASSPDYMETFSTCHLYQ